MYQTLSILTSAEVHGFSNAVKRGAVLRGDSQKRLLRGVMRKDATARPGPEAPHLAAVPSRLRPSASALLQHAWVAGRDDAGDGKTKNARCAFSRVETLHKF